MSRERFLARLEEEMGRALPREEAAEFVSEARAHLADDIQARLELGSTLEEAERESIAAFGSSRAITRKAASEERGFCLVLAVLGLFWSFLALVPNMPHWAEGPILVAFFAVHTSYLWASGRNRRLRFGWVALAAETAGVTVFANNVLKSPADPVLSDLAVEAFAALIGFAGFVFVVYGLLHLLGWVVGNAVRRDRLRRS